MEKYNLSDLSLVAFLEVAGFEIEKLDTTNLNRTLFTFARTPNLEKAMKDYYNGKARVEPSQYFFALKNIKARIYNR